MWGVRVPISSLVLCALRLVALTPAVVTSNEMRFHDFSVGYTSCAVVDDGYVYCWGENRDGMQGRTSPSKISQPTRVYGPTNVIAVKVAVTHVCSLSLNGEVYCWGKVRDNAIQPVQRYFGGLPAKALAVAKYGTCIISFGDDVYCMGMNYGFRFSGASTTTNYAYPQRLTTEGIPRGNLGMTEDAVCVLRSDNDYTSCRGTSVVKNNLDGRWGHKLTCHEFHCCHQSGKL